MQNLVWKGSKCPDALYTFPIDSHEGPVNEEESKIDISHDLWCGKTLNQWTPHTNSGQKRTPHLTFLSWGETHCTGASRAFADHWPPLFRLLGRNLELHPQSLDLKPNCPLKCSMLSDQSGLRQLSLFSQSGSSTGGKENAHPSFTFYTPADQLLLLQ